MHAPAQSSDIVFDPIEMHAQMNENGTTTLQVRARANNEDSSAVSSIRYRVESLEVSIISTEVNNQAASSVVSASERYSEIVITLTEALAPLSSIWIDMELSVLDLQSDLELGLDSTYLQGTFILYIRPLNTLRNFTLTTSLPESALLSQESVSPLFPDADLNSTDGRSLKFTWNIATLQPGQEKVFIIKYQLPNLQSSPTEIVIAGGVIFGLLGLVSGILLMYFGPLVVRRVREMKQVRIVGVTAEEEEVLDIIRRKGGSCNQKELYTQLNMSQSKVSIILGNLEERGLVTRVRDGRVNIINLVEEEP